MNKQYSADIIILSWDRLEDTIAAIESSLEQKGVALSVIVVDQGSKPETIRTLRSYCNEHPQITLVCNQENKGVPGGRNQASALGSSEFIVSLDNDAEFADEFQVAKACELMAEREDLGALAFRILRHGSNDDDVTSWSYHQSLDEWSTQSFYTDRFVGAGHLIRRVAFDSIGGYDATLFFLHEEVDLSKRLINANFKILYTPEVVIGHKVSKEHRVAWTAGRWVFDVRNRTYLHMKHKTFFPTAVFHTWLMVHKGFKSGLYGSTLTGLCKGFGLFPQAIKSWQKDPALTVNEQAQQYLDECSPTQGMSIVERVKMRVRNNGSLPLAKESGGDK
ncbi:glycosyltransferase family 2 protein [Vibrio maritimus]|uniref:glycosyltransferase family 2 protein n=1 Tax=Vibrio maritimus TaxID=990268 RepID=UPI001F48BD6E|nr:glycosyltransferase [Vibrio maritimus]